MAWAGFGVASLAAFASVLSWFPQTVGFAPLARGAEEVARQAAANIPSECPSSMCDGGPSLHQLDGGRCECL
jgi:hypothetical protein